MFPSCFKLFFATLALCLVATIDASSQTTTAPPRDWLRKVRIAAYPLSADNAEQIVRDAAASNVYGIEVDNDIPGRYESLLHPEAKLAAIRAVSLAAHRQGNKAFVYIAGTECISANANAAHTLAKDHPDWLQRTVAGKPAVFGHDAAFWIAPGEEDAWVSPFAGSWRQLYMERVGQIAATGVDGIYVDIPYWMTHFTGWEDTWASFDPATVAAFKQQTGIDAKTVHIGDFNDPAFRKWVTFRIQTLTDFLAEIRRTAVSVNPSISLIPEIYPGIESEATRVGADVYQMYAVSDAIAHEYEFGAGDDHTAASRPTFDWLMYQIGMRSFRAFAGDKPTWILNYSWDGAKGVSPADAMQTLFASELMAGANVWDASGHVMSGSNDLPERTRIYAWIAAHEAIFGQLRQPVGSVGVYFSDTTRNQHPAEFIASYRGAILTLLQNHRQFRIVTPRTLAAFHGQTLILPSVRELDPQEIASLRHFVTEGGHVVATGFTHPEVAELPWLAQLPQDPSGAYLVAAQKDLATADPTNLRPFLAALGAAPASEPDLTAGAQVVAHAATLGGVNYLFLVNFTGIVAGSKLTPTSQTGITVSLPASAGTTLHLLPFLGVSSVLTGTRTGDRMLFTLPPLERAAILWSR